MPCPGRLASIITAAKTELLLIEHVLPVRGSISTVKPALEGPEPVMNPFVPASPMVNILIHRTNVVDFYVASEESCALLYRVPRIPVLLPVHHHDQPRCRYRPAMPTSAPTKLARLYAKINLMVLTLIALPDVGNISFARLIELFVAVFASPACYSRKRVVNQLHERYALRLRSVRVSTVPTACIVIGALVHRGSIAEESG